MNLYKVTKSNGKISYVVDHGFNNVLEKGSQELPIKAIEEIEIDIKIDTTWCSSIMEKSCELTKLIGKYHNVDRCTLDQAIELMDKTVK